MGDQRPQVVHVERHGRDFLIVMCRTDDPDGPAERNGKMTQIIVPTDTPGVNIIRGIEVWGKNERPRRDHLRRRARSRSTTSSARPARDTRPPRTGSVRAASFTA